MPMFEYDIKEKKDFYTTVVFRMSAEFWDRHRTFVERIRTDNQRDGGYPITEHGVESSFDIKFYHASHETTEHVIQTLNLLQDNNVILAPGFNNNDITDGLKIEFDNAIFLYKSNANLYDIYFNAKNKKNRTGIYAHRHPDCLEKFDRNELEFADKLKHLINKLDLVCPRDSIGEEKKTATNFNDLIEKEQSFFSYCSVHVVDGVRIFSPIHHRILNHINEDIRSGSHHIQKKEEISFYYKTENDPDIFQEWKVRRETDSNTITNMNIFNQMVLTNNHVKTVLVPYERNQPSNKSNLGYCYRIYVGQRLIYQFSMGLSENVPLFLQNLPNIIHLINQETQNTNQPLLNSEQFKQDSLVTALIPQTLFSSNNRKSQQSEEEHTENNKINQNDCLIS